MPYLTGIDTTFSSSVAMINSAHTWVELAPDQNGIGNNTYSAWAMESGALEFFVFASAMDNSDLNKFKKVQYDLATVSGMAPLPLINYLGYHFCKWDWVSDNRMRERNANFTKFDIPVDVLWMDIEWADYDSDPEGYEYFIFNPQNFTSHNTSLMNSEIESAGRGMVVIVDPHIKAVSNYSVFAAGIAEQEQGKNIFV